MLVDYEKAWLQMREHLKSKSGHGTFGPQGLLARMADIEVECRVEEGPSERVMRLFGVQLSEDLIQFPGQTTDEAPNGHESSEAPGRLQRSRA